MMEMAMLAVWVFILGLRHGLDADHLACIDGLVRNAWQKKSPVTRWVGSLFSFGHGLTVALIGIVLGTWTEDFAFPAYFDTAVLWVSAGSLLTIGSMNLIQLLKPVRTGDKEDYKPVGLKGKWLPRFVRNTTNPYLIVLIGAVMALAADTVSQTAVWALAAGQSGVVMPAVLGAIFMLGMMVTDTADSLMMHRILGRSGRLGRQASRLMGWVIVSLAFGVCFLQVLVYFQPWAELDAEVLGIGMFGFVVLVFLVLLLLARKSGNETNSLRKKEMLP